VISVLEYIQVVQPGVLQELVKRGWIRLAETQTTIQVGEREAWQLMRHDYDRLTRRRGRLRRSRVVVLR
jgi:hypothetical protein